MAGNGIVCATEKWIKNKLKLEVNALDTVTSLTLPGRYHEKITHIGRSLLSFSNLRCLDLSRNALETLEGLEHLKYLESLNLYYNNIPDLKEVFRLRHNTKLEDVDLRLNPVTKNEPDYRLFTIHMLIHLRTLDDRSVTDGERKAALMHFDTDQAYDFDKASRQHTNSPSLSPSERPPLKSCAQSRLDLVQSVACKRQGLGVDTEELVDLMVERGVVGGTVFVQGTRESTRHRDKSGGKTTGATKVGHSDDRELCKKPKPLTENTRTGNKTLHTIPAAAVINKELTETEAYNSSIRPMVTYTPHPSQENGGHAGGTSSKKGTPKKEKLTELRLFEDMRYKEELISLLKAQVDVLSTKVAEMGKAEEREKEIEKALKQTHSEMTLLHQNCQSLLNENISLKTAASLSLPENQATSNSAELKQILTGIGLLRQHQDTLSNEIHRLSERQTSLLSHSSQLQKLAVMLQESHRSLVSTNTHLLQEIEEIKRNHTIETSQLQTNYEHLRKTLQKIKL